MRIYTKYLVQGLLPDCVGNYPLHENLKKWAVRLHSSLYTKCKTISVQQLLHRLRIDLFVSKHWIPCRHGPSRQIMMRWCLFHGTGAKSRSMVFFGATYVYQDVTKDFKKHRYFTKNYRYLSPTRKLWRGFTTNSIPTKGGKLGHCCG